MPKISIKALRRTPLLELNTVFNAILATAPEHGLNVELLDLDADLAFNTNITSGSGDSEDQQGGGELRFIVPGDIAMNSEGIIFLGAEAHLILAADNIFNTTADRNDHHHGGDHGLTRDEGSEVSGTEIVIEETDDLVVYGRSLGGGLGPVGLSSAHGEIEVTISLRLPSDPRHRGHRCRTAEMDIRLQADDFDFISGPESRIDPQGFVAFEDRSEVRSSRSEGGIIGTSDSLTRKPRRSYWGQQLSIPMG